MSNRPINRPQPMQSRPENGTESRLGAKSGLGPESDPSQDDEKREFLRAPNEDDDGYDPYSDRRPVTEPLFEPDPWV